MSHHPNAHKPETVPLLLTSREAAKALAVCEKTLYHMTKRGELRVVRIGRAVRYSTDTLRHWIAKQEQV